MIKKLVKPEVVETEDKVVALTVQVEAEKVAPCTAGGCATDIKVYEDEEIDDITF